MDVKKVDDWITVAMGLSILLLVWSAWVIGLLVLIGVLP